MDRRRLKSKLLKQSEPRTSQLLTEHEDRPNESMLKDDDSLARKRKKSSILSEMISDDNLEGSAIDRSPLAKRRRGEQKFTQVYEDPTVDRNLESAELSGIFSDQSDTSVTETSRETEIQMASNTRKSRKRTSESNSAYQTKQSGTPQKRSYANPSQKNKSGNKLMEFLNESGVILSLDGDSHLLNDDAPTVRQNMEKLLISQKYKKKDIICLWQRHIQDEANLRGVLNEMKVSNDQGNVNDSNKTSLAKIFLQVLPLQTGVINSLLDRLVEAILVANSMDDVPWTNLLLQQLRFLEEVVDFENLTARLEELLESCPVWFQRELILFLPDILIETKHYSIAEMLCKLMEDNSELTTVILDCIINLTLGKEYLEELRDKVLNMLKSNLQLSTLPAIARFVLNDCTSMDICQKIISTLRIVDMQPLVGEKLEDCFTNQVLTVNALKISILLSKEMANAATTVVQNIKKEPKPLDLILVLLIFSTVKKKNIESILRHHIRSGLYRASLLNVLYNDYKEVARNLQPAALQLASTLLKSEDRIFIDFAVEWFRHLFISQADTIHKQREIIEKIILLMGSNDQTVKNALMVLYKMAEKNEERKHLQTHCNHLRILLEKIENLNLEEVATLSDLLHGLCTDSNSMSDALRDDLFILLQKQLSNAKPITKCKGVLGAVMAIKHLAGKSETCEMAYDLFKRVLTGVKNCSRSQAVFYDQMANIIANTENIDVNILNKFTEHFVDEFINSHMTDKSSHGSEEMTPMYGLNSPDEEPENGVVYFKDGKYGAIVPALFRLLRISYLRISDNGDLNEINALLGSAILMPKDLQVAEPFVLDCMLHCVNWFREVISGFVTQTNPLLQKQVLKRLDDLMYLQGELNMMLTLCEARYQPPPCYFHYFPVPQFIRVEKKVGKKGKKSNLEKSGIIPEWESWEMGSMLSCKNPAYFRRLDAKVVHLLDINMDLQLSQASSQNISIAQVCFLIKELLGMFENEVSETFMRDLVHLLPKICTKLQHVVMELRQNDDKQTKEAVKLLLRLLSTIFNWKGFNSNVYNSMLRESLRTVASQINQSNLMLRSSKELVTESYKYFESLADIATQISIAIVLVDVCRSVTQHSETFTQQHKEKLAKMAFGFLCLEWSEDKHTGPIYKAALQGLLKVWIENEPNPLDTVTIVLEWLPDEVAKLEKSQDYLNRLPTVNRSNFHLLFKKIFDGLIMGVKISLSAAKTDPKRVEVWQSVASSVQKIVHVCKTLKMKANLLLFVRYMPVLLKLFLSCGMPILEHNLKYQMEEVTGILKLMQGGTRYLHTVCCDSTERRDVTLTKHIPAAKSVLERLVYSVKGMLVLNNSPTAFWMGNLVNKNLEGHEILSQTTSSEEPTSSNVDIGSTDNITDDVLSDVLNSDLDNSDEETEDK